MSVLKLVKIPHYHSLRDETKTFKDMRKCFLQNKIVQYHNKKTVTIKKKKYKDFQKLLLKGMRLFEDEWVRNQCLVLAYSLLLHFLTCRESDFCQQLEKVV